MVVNWFWGALQAHSVIYDLLKSQFRQHLEVYQSISFYLFGTQDPPVEFVVLNHRVEDQSKTVSHMENMCKYLLLGVN